MKQRIRQTGFTLIELLLYVALLGILLSAVTAFFVTTIESRVKNQAITEVNEQGVFAVEYLSRTIRSATSIGAPLSGVTSNTLSAIVSTSSLSPTVFNLTDGTLQVTKGLGETIALTNDKVQVLSLDVTNLTRSGTSDIIQISITISHVNPADRAEYSYEKTFTTTVGVRP